MAICFIGRAPCVPEAHPCKPKRQSRLCNPRSMINTVHMFVPVSFCGYREYMVVYRFVTENLPQQFAVSIDGVGGAFDHVRRARMFEGLQWDSALHHLIPFVWPVGGTSKAACTFFIQRDTKGWRRIRRCYDARTILHNTSSGTFSHTRPRTAKS